MQRGLIISAILVMASVFSYGQGFKPQWMRNVPMPLTGNASYVFVSINADAYSLDMGRKKCLQMLSLDRGLLSTVTLTYKSEDHIYSVTQSRDDNFKENIDEKSFEVITMDGKPVQLQAHIVDEYFDIKHNSMTTLYQVALYPNSVFDNAIVTSKYDVSHVWPSFLVPGSGQMYKGDWLKGGLFMGGTVALAGGALFTHLQSNIYNRKVYEAGGKEEAMRIYANRARNFGTARNVCLGGLAALYVYNVIDAFVAPGAKRVEVIPNGVAVNF